MSVVKSIVALSCLSIVMLSSYSCKKCMTCTDHCCYIESIDTFFCYEYSTFDSSDRMHLDSIVKIHGNCKNNLERVSFKTCNLDENEVKYLEQEGIYCGYLVK